MVDSIVNRVTFAFSVVTGDIYMRARRSASTRPASKRGERWNGAVAGREEQHEQKRLAILEQAARLFDERGYYETSLSDIAASLHVTKPTLYYYVKNKEDIVRQLVEAATEAVEQTARKASTGGTNGLDRLRLFVRGYVELMNTEYGRCLLTLRRIPAASQTRSRMAAGYRRIDALGRDFIS